MVGKISDIKHTLCLSTIAAAIDKFKFKNHFMSLLTQILILILLKGFYNSFLRVRDSVGGDVILHTLVIYFSMLFVIGPKSFVFANISTIMYYYSIIKPESLPVNSAVTAKRKIRVSQLLMYLELIANIFFLIAITNNYDQIF